MKKKEAHFPRIGIEGPETRDIRTRPAAEERSPPDPMDACSRRQNGRPVGERNDSAALSRFTNSRHIRG